MDKSTEKRFDHIEQMISELIHTVGTIKTVIEEDREENNTRFEKIDQRFEKMDHRFDEVMAGLNDYKIEHKILATRTIQNEMDIEKLKKAYFA